MTTNNYAVIGANGNVLNVVVWDGGAEWTPPVGTTTVQVTGSTGPAYIGGTWSGTLFSAPSA